MPAGIRFARADLPLSAIDLEYPLALKLLNAQLPHKSDVGALQLGLDGPQDIDAAIAAIDAAVARAAPAVKRETFLLESMVGDFVAELIVGVRGDPQFGPLLVIASGGVLVELLGDAQTLLLPAAAGDIRAALEKLRAWSLLQGYRGNPAANLEALVDTIAKIADHAVESCDSLLELDVNPLMVTPAGAVAADVLIVETDA